ncbi:putative cytochrome P450 303a1 [Nomia melanderi]|uniref:putative cytochrome P450 303a1 n=1 Tax=Nomia melanderi TaxID=2448451 RepID=UPI00130427B9|nr:probable cytochrome P450 303a1 [Nomia melanderi]
MLYTLLLLVILLLLLFHLGTRKPEGYPPGPKWWPILGSAVEIARLREKTGFLFKTCSALCEKYGPVVGLKIGVDRMVVLNDYESIRSMLANEDCDGRPIGPVYETRTFGARRGLIVVDENLWVEQRRFVLKQLREFGFGRKSMAVIIEEETRWLIEHFKKLISVELDNKIKAESAESRCNNNVEDDGKIYKLIETNAPEKSANEPRAKTEKPLKASDMYVDANEYPEVRRMAGSNPGIVIPMHDAFGVTVLNTLWRMMAGKRFDVDHPELNYLQRILSKLMRNIDMVGAPFGHFPFLRFIAPELSGYKSFLEIHQELWKFLQEELDNHKNTFKPDSPRDLMDVYLGVLKSENYSSTFSESQLLAICVDLFMAGSETTSNTLAFFFLNIILYPSVQAKAHEEIDRVVGRDRFPTLEDRPNMPYMTAIVLESLRLFMGRTLNVPHRALRDTTILGYKIPKDTMLIVNFNGILMDESWGDPEVFRPERFIDESGNIVTPNTYFPFSIGRHRCMGETLAKSNLFIIITALLQQFTFSTVPGERKPSHNEISDGVTSSPNPYRVLISLRT